MTLAVANLTVAAALAGLIWTIPLVLPLMLANVALAVALIVHDASVLAALNLALAGGVFAATGAVFAPMHGRLAAAWDGDLHGRLVALNALRTAAWTAQVAVSLALVL